MFVCVDVQPTGYQLQGKSLRLKSSLEKASVDLPSLSVFSPLSYYATAAPSSELIPRINKWPIHLNSSSDLFFFLFPSSTQVDLSGGLGPLVKHERLPSV